MVRKRLGNSGSIIFAIFAAICQHLVFVVEMLFGQRGNMATELHDTSRESRFPHHGQHLSLDALHLL
jgi:hypothetical protein